jgi:hypothetical protein
MFTGATTGSWQPWSTGADVIQADSHGRFAAVLPPGRYRVNAVRSALFASRAEARVGLSRIAFGGTMVALPDRASKEVVVTLHER